MLEVVLGVKQSYLMKKNYSYKNCLMVPDKCYQCGSTDHFAKDCKMYQKKPKHTKITCERCGRFGHSEETCYAKTDVNGKKLMEKKYYAGNANSVVKSLILKRDVLFTKMFIVLREGVKMNTEIPKSKGICYLMNYMMIHPMMKILYVIVVEDLVTNLLNVMLNDTRKDIG